VDDALDRVLGDPALPEDTLVVLTSDHGEEFGEHGGAYHGTTLFDEQIRVPAWVWSRAGGLAPSPGAAVSATLATYDLMPTLLDLVGVVAPSGIIGRSWAPALMGRGALPEAPVLMTSTLHRTLFGAAAGLDKLVFEPAAGVAAYYDLAQDPEERANRIDAAPERVAPLACQLSTVARKP
jgi:arylsulfatase A-like enzyme